MKTNLVKSQNYKLFKYNLLKLQIKQLREELDVCLKKLNKFQRNIALKFHLTSIY